MMKKFGSNWKKLASNITNVKRQSSSTEDDTLSIPSIVATGKVHNYMVLSCIRPISNLRKRYFSKQLYHN